MQHDKVFRRNTPGAKKATLDMAFQVGTFCGGDYTGSFVSILKTVLMCQALNINLNIDVFDSDVAGVGGGPAYIICNVAKSCEKLNFRKLLVSSHREFFSYSLFNGYSAAGQRTNIMGFLDEHRIARDLGSRYDVIGGNHLTLDDSEEQQLVSKILKIAWR
jgi:hypothetical protein